MFLASDAKPIDDNLKNLVDKIEAQSAGLSVLAARQLRYSLRQNTVELTIKEPRQFNVLEEFIIRAGIEFEPAPTADELASILGLDAVFVKSTISTLQSLQTLAVTSPITVTTEGRLFYEKGTVPQPPYSVQIYAVTDFLGGNISFQSESLSDVTTKLPDLATFVNIENKINNISSLTLETIQQILQDSDLAFHVPEEGKIVTAFKVIPPTQIFWKTVSLFVIFDALEDKLSIQLRKGKQILEAASNWLESLLNQGKISLQTLCEVSDQTINFERQAILKQKNEEIESRLEKIRQQVLETVQEAGTAVQLRDGEINQAFLEVLNSAKNQILFYYPLISQAVVDDKFLTLLQKLVNGGVGILIGYGIAQPEEDEERQIPPEVKAKLQSIKTLEGLPGVQIFWSENSHIKEVIVDQQIHLCGCYNQLFYRGGYLPTGESVYKVTIPELVQEAYQFFANRCQNHAQKLWVIAVQNYNSQLAVESLCIWGAMGMEEIAIKEIEANNWLELVPIWLNVVIQRLRAKILPAGLQTALVLLNKFSGEEIFIDLLVQGWRRVISNIASQNPQTAVDLFSNGVWEQFLRLQIVQPTESLDTFILSQNETQKPVKKKIAKKKLEQG
ncbi:hypothetical protein H6G54_23730 [Anabaena cylindrica FACHB-243]|uniref:Uncharacterized protein n=1 Tax=Anabaena cylindrica (strain ATCC 27899 / PCC 7122) TaxID=272123 RepID=K9ZIH3_ANACC|nr:MULTISPECIES: hypothetical protein [Anabaena]AFZ58996.1 hypothetical protein Anacy_3603 [Anabaena cylindrica PCC 7122]MBD2420660.1 hypothetical protein [Anabaena cylindrica FACHB-243]MBY5281444.1 hypothetical protein [Anabaena sp. CCAP 1446/1C]MBY5311097.1 hypothetical protein [Anabaena sp. CCAP 1446/1C]MCM2410001.1 hypothetical protein [Anabaena sp. CCAP 1446/1C]